MSSIDLFECTSLNIRITIVTEAKMTTQVERILVLNPNSSTSMTHGLEEVIRGMNLPQSAEISFYTAPSDSPASINDGDDVLRSSDVVYKHLTESGTLQQYDAVLVACFSVHPLVRRLSELEGARGKLLVTGIYEAAVTFSVNQRPPRKWGIVTTGKFWEAHLTEGLDSIPGVTDVHDRFAGVESTGLDAGDFHGGVDPAVVRQKLVEATKRLLGKGAVGCVIMGCAGMAGLEDIIRSAAVEEYGAEQGNRVIIVDGVWAGVEMLQQAVHNRER
ncbi:protein DCG1 [Podospora conica]|nr:protein DCG1 [Schizothecium conicum]